MSWRLIEFECPTHGRFEELLPRSEAGLPSSTPCATCGSASDRVISAPKTGTVWGSVVSRAKSDPRPNPGVLNTESLADGKSFSEWKKERHEFRRSESIAEARRKFGT